MSETIEARLDRLEAELSELKQRVDSSSSKQPGRMDWLQTFGMSANDPEFDEMVRLGAEYRKAQRWEDEPDAGAGH
jgi:hypothetical protein